MEVCRQIQEIRFLPTMIDDSWRAPLNRWGIVRLWFLLFVFAVGVLWGKGAPVFARGTAGADTSVVDVRTPSSEALARYRNDPDYTYAQSQGLTWWDQFWAWVFDQLGEMTNVPWGEEILIVLAVLVSAGILLIAARWIFRMRPTSPVDGESPLSPEAPVTREALETVDFAAEAEAAEDDGAYRRAVRYHYLALLQHLVRADLVVWTSDKSNRALVRETQGTPVHDPFDRATELFEIVWYGDMALDRSTYAQIRDVLARARTRTPPDVSSPEPQPAS